MPGVLRVTVGYSGGREANPTYSNIKDHTEAVRVEFDPTAVSYSQLLEHYFEQALQTPLALLQPAYSCQYRHLLLVHSPMQYEVTQRQLERVRRLLCVDEGEWLHVEVQSAGNFYRAEEYHQNFLDKNSTSSSKL